MTTMERHVLLSLLLLLLSLVVFDASDAFFVGGHRKLANLDSEGGKKSATPGSPVPNQENLDPNHVGGTKKKEEESHSTNNNSTQEKGTKGSINSSKSNGNNSISPAPAPLPKVKDSNGPQKEPNKTASGAGNGGGEGKGKDDGNGNRKDGGKGRQEKKENEGKTYSQSATNETCDDKQQKCRDSGGMVGCISEIDPTYVVVLLHNGGNDAIKVKLNESNFEGMELGTNKTKKVNIPVSTSERTQLTFNAGKGDCVLHMGALVPGGGYFVRLPSYDKILTPVNGAYFLVLTVLVFGGTWACCKCRKKQHDEVPYQELEMALPESALATNVESAEGWDQGWDDDWDDDVAVKSPAMHHAGSISANGLTSRSSNKDGWENNWDD